MVGWACLLCVVWAAVGVNGGHHGIRDKEVAAPGVLVETLRQVLRVPTNEGGPGGYGRPPRPPRYMLRLYRKLSKGRSSLPRRANTVRSFTSLPGEAALSGPSLLVYNVSSSADEHVMGAWLHVRGGGARLSPGPSRLLLYLLHRGESTPTDPIMTVAVKPGTQEVEVTRAVREVLMGGQRAPGSVWGTVGVRVEEGGRGHMGRGSQTKTRPLLLVYTSDPAILDLTALGVSALNLTHLLPPRPRPAHAHSKRYRGRSPPASHRVVGRARRSSREGVEAGVVLPGSAHSHALLTNELPLGHAHTLLQPHTSHLPQARKVQREERRLRRKQRGRRKGSLIPLPKNYSKTKWGEDTSLRQDRRRRRRRRRNRRLPKEWTKAAQNLVSNRANALLGGGVGRACQREQLEVDFEKLGWNHFIVAPDSFNAFYCAGVCPNPLTKSLSGSNHAIIQSLIYSMGQHPEVPAPCCVPDKLESLSILFLDEQGTFILKNYPKMVVSSCSCQ
ncbi:uncharacterized protein [Panulirus ornatus]|uniref:uncharacterized protein isoform X2 n=1 Tax=Panulirus ornatus TaxID=150431 RepID=UPI003A89B0F4